MRGNVAIVAHRMVLRVATCQFPISADISSNARYVVRQLRSAHERGAQIAHFAECALSGYAGSDFSNYRKFDWAALREATDQVLELTPPFVARASHAGRIPQRETAARSALGGSNETLSSCHAAHAGVRAVVR